MAWFTLKNHQILWEEMKKYVYIFNGFKYYIFSIPSTIDSYTMQWCIHIIPKVYLPQGAYHQGRQTATTTVWLSSTYNLGRSQFCTMWTSSSRFFVGRSIFCANESIIRMMARRPWITMKKWGSQWEAKVGGWGNHIRL